MPIGTVREKSLLFPNIPFNLPRRKYFGQGEVLIAKPSRKTQEIKRNFKMLKRDDPAKSSSPTDGTKGAKTEE